MYRACRQNLRALFLSMQEKLKKATDVSRQRPLTSYILLLTSLLIDVDRRSLGEGDAVGLVEGVEVHLTHADVEGDGGQGAQELAMRTWLQQRQRQFVPPFLLRALADLPDEVVGGAKAEPCFEDVAHAVAAMLSEVEPPRVLQLAPELHEAS